MRVRNGRAVNGEHVNVDDGQNSGQNQDKKRLGGGGGELEWFPAIGSEMVLDMGVGIDRACDI